MIDFVQCCAAVLLLVGAVFSLLGAIGLLRLPDVYTRLHAASKAGIVGAGLMLVAAGLAAGEGAILLRALLGVVFMLLATPLSAHLLARAARKSGVEADPRTSIEQSSRE